MLTYAAPYYAGMFLSFMQKSFNYNLSTLGKQMTLVAFNVVLTATNLVGIGVAGSASVVFLVVVLSPVAILVLVAMPHMSLGVLLATTPKLNFFEWVNIIVWNTNRCVHRAPAAQKRGVLDVRIAKLVVILVVKLVIHTTQSAESTEGRRARRTRRPS
jgi:amino acid transporter